MVHDEEAFRSSSASPLQNADVMMKHGWAPIVTVLVIVIVWLLKRSKRT